jgi:hypothetical protein
VVDHADGHSIDEHVVDGDIGEVFCDLLDDLRERVETRKRKVSEGEQRRKRAEATHLVPEHHPVALSVRLGDVGEHLARTGLCKFEGEAGNASDSDAGEDRDLY